MNHGANIGMTPAHPRLTFLQSHGAGRYQWLQSGDVGLHQNESKQMRGGRTDRQTERQSYDESRCAPLDKTATFADPSDNNMNYERNQLIASRPRLLYTTSGVIVLHDSLSTTYKVYSWLHWYPVSTCNDFTLLALVK